MVREVIAALMARELSKGCLAYGYGQEGSKPGEIIPWNDNFKVDRLSILGAMCFVTKCALDDDSIQDLYCRMSVELGQDVETWNDDLRTTKQQVLDFLATFIE